MGISATTDRRAFPVMPAQCQTRRRMRVCSVQMAVLELVAAATAAAPGRRTVPIAQAASRAALVLRAATLWTVYVRGAMPAVSHPKTERRVWTVRQGLRGQVARARSTVRPERSRMQGAQLARCVQQADTARAGLVALLAPPRATTLPTQSSASNAPVGRDRRRLEPSAWLVPTAKPALGACARCALQAGHRLRMPQSALRAMRTRRVLMARAPPVLLARNPIFHGLRVRNV